MLGAHYSSSIILRSFLCCSFWHCYSPEFEKKKNTDHCFWVCESNQVQICTEFLWNCWEFLNKADVSSRSPQDCSIIRCQCVLILGWKNLVTMCKGVFITLDCNYFLRNLSSPSGRGVLQDKSRNTLIFHSQCLGSAWCLSKYYILIVKPRAAVTETEEADF